MKIIKIEYDFLWSKILLSYIIYTKTSKIPDRILTKTINHNEKLNLYLLRHVLYMIQHLLRFG